MMAVTITMMLMMIMAITIMMMLMMMLTREPVAFFCYFSSFELMTRGKKVLMLMNDDDADADDTREKMKLSLYKLVRGAWEVSWGLNEGSLDFSTGSLFVL